MALWDCEIWHPIWFERQLPIVTQALWRLILARIYPVGNRMHYRSGQDTLHQHICVILWIGYKRPYIAAWMTSCKCEGWSLGVHKGNPRKSRFVLVRQGWRILCRQEQRCTICSYWDKFAATGSPGLQQLHNQKPVTHQSDNVFQDKNTITSSHQDVMPNTSLRQLTRKRFQKFK